MTVGTHYPNAPITEAVIDIQVAPQVNLDALEKSHIGEAGYPTIEKLNAASGQMTFGPDANAFAAATSQPFGYLYRSLDQLQIYQARSNGFTFSRLGRYPHWNAIRAEAQRLWEKYRAAAHSSEITRVAVRYVNRIDIPLPFNSFTDYLRTVPQLSPDLPMGLSGYFMQLVIHLAEINGDGIINQTIIEPAKPGVVSVVLDIDIFRTIEIPQSEAELWNLFEDLREQKNKVFEACITDEARRLFQ
jgi:uncharacterized protein (TIGR04255 family)